MIGVPRDQEHSTGELVKLLSEQASVLIRDELKLARLEMASKGSRRNQGEDAPVTADELRQEIEQTRRSQAVQRRWPVAVAAGVLVAGAGVVAVWPWERQA